MRYGIFAGDGNVTTLLETARQAEADGFDSFWLPQIFGVDALRDPIAAKRMTAWLPDELGLKTRAG